MMKKERFIWLAAVVTWATLASKLQAQEELLFDPQRTWAIIVGVDSYLHLDDLSYTSSDAQLMYTYLTDSLGLRLMPERVFVHLSPGRALGSTQGSWRVGVRAEQKHTPALPPPSLPRYPVAHEATVESIKKSLDYILRNAKEGDALIFYFAGHGQIHDGKLYLCTFETPRILKDDEALALEEILVKITGSKGKRSPIKTAWLVIDSCYSGAGEQDVKTVLGELRQIEAALGDRGVGIQVVEPAQSQSASQTAASQAAPRFFVLFSARDYERAYEPKELGNGVFTYYLVRALRGGAFGAYVRQFARSPGRIVAADLGSYMQSAVGEFLYRTTGASQSPTFFPELDKVARLETVSFNPLFGISVIVDASIATEARVEAVAPYNPTLKIVKEAPCVFSIQELDRTFREMGDYTLRIYPKSQSPLTITVPLTLEAPSGIRLSREKEVLKVNARLGERELRVEAPLTTKNPPVVQFFRTSNSTTVSARLEGSEREVQIVVPFTPNSRPVVRFSRADNMTKIGVRLDENDGEISVEVHTKALLTAKNPPVVQFFRTGDSTTVSARLEGSEREVQIVVPFTPNSRPVVRFSRADNMTKIGVRLDENDGEISVEVHTKRSRPLQTSPLRLLLSREGEAINISARLDEEELKVDKKGDAFVVYY
jgi:uncharacterized caspase-like protein/DNA/RNA endonuclease YhcR with UshA esterase domain